MDPQTIVALEGSAAGAIVPYIAVAVPAVSFAASILSALLPDGHPLMKIINAIAVNVGKAKNDPGAQAKAKA